jgi:hypothetical protein
VVTLVRSQVRYFIRDQDCIGRSCLELGPAVKVTFDDQGIDIRCRMRSACRTMLQKGCPRELPAYDALIAAKRMANGVCVAYEPTLTRTRTLPIPDAAFARRDATPYLP